MTMRAKTFRGGASALALVLSSGCVHRALSTQDHVASVTQAAASGFRVLDLTAFRGYDSEAVMAKVVKIAETLAAIFARADREGRPTDAVAEAMAREIVEAART